MSDANSYLKHFSDSYSKDIDEYATNHALDQSRYIFVRSEGPNIQFGYCTHCKCTFNTYINTDSIILGERLKHNWKHFKCPSCDSECTVKSHGMGRKYLSDRAYFVYYEKSAFDPKVIVARGIIVTRNYSGDYTKVKNEFNTRVWYVFDTVNGSAMLEEMSPWERGYDKDKAINLKKYVSVHCRFQQFNSKAYLSYSRDSIKKAVQSTSFAWSGWESYNYQDMTKFFRLYVKYPCIEYLTKLGFYNLIRDILHGDPTYHTINWHGKTIYKVLKLSKEEFGYVKVNKINLTYWFLYLMNLNRRNNWGFSISNLYNLSFDIDSMHDVNRLLDAERQSGISFKNLVKYLSSQKGKWPRSSPVSSNCSDYLDYLKDCKTLKYDMSDEKVLLPSNLVKAHEETIKLIKYKANKELDKKIKLRGKQLNQFCFEFNGLIFKAPQSSKEIIDEGVALKHCVGGYCKSHANGDTNIFFIRSSKKPNKPYYTLEVSKDFSRIIQCRGMNNKDTTENVKKLLEQFKLNLEKMSKNKRSKTKIRIPA
jgi:hypothetical protein